MFWILPGILAVSIGVYSIVVFIVNRRVRAARRLTFVSRGQGEISAWFRENFADAGLDEEECARVLEPVANAIGCDVTQLRPDDAFLGNLQFRGMRWLGLDGGDLLEDYLEYELSLVIGETRANAVQERAEHLHTLGDVVRAIGEARRLPEVHYGGGVRRPRRGMAPALIASGVLLLAAAAWFLLSAVYWGWVSATPDAARLSATTRGNLYCAATLLALVGSIVSIVLGVRRWRQKPPEGACAGCGYDRRGLAADTKCPECGAADPPRPS